MMALGAAGKALIESFEECKLASYQDQAGVWTIGWGHTGPNVGPGLTCNQDAADNWFAADVLTAVQGVWRTIMAPITQNQFDALVSFTFNVGAGSEAHSALCRMVNAGDLIDAADQFLVWNHVDGVVNAGLTRRRAAERALFLGLG
jgi:lysozyme